MSHRRNGRVESHVSSKWRVSVPGLLRVIERVGHATKQRKGGRRQIGSVDFYVSVPSSREKFFYILLSFFFFGLGVSHSLNYQIPVCAIMVALINFVACWTTLVKCMLRSVAF